MMGKTHKLTAVTAGIATAAILGLKPEVMSGIYVYTPLAVTTVMIGALLPDMDHHNTKYGKNLQKIKKVLLIVAIVSFLLIFIPNLVIYAMTQQIKVDVLLLRPILVICILSTISFALIENIKHRGITHDIWIPLILFLVTHKVLNGLVLKESIIITIANSLIFGLIFGYVHHLYADACTTQGITILWPMKLTIKLPPSIVCGGKAESIWSIVQIILSVVVVGIYYYFKLTR